MSLRSQGQPLASIFAHCAAVSSTVRGISFSSGGFGGLPPLFFGVSMQGSLAHTKTACKVGLFRSY